MFELIWWSVHNNILGKDDFIDSSHYLDFKNEDHSSSISANLVRNNFRNRVWSVWTDYTERFLLAATPESHSTGTERIGVPEVLQVTKDYLLQPGVFGAITKTGCCLSNTDSRWCDFKHMQYHVKKMKTSIETSLKLDLLWNSPSCTCGKNEDRLLLFPDILVFFVQPGNSISIFFSYLTYLLLDTNWLNEYQFAIDSYYYKLYSIIYFNGIDGRNSPSNHYYISILVCIYTFKTFFILIQANKHSCFKIDGLSGGIWKKQENGKLNPDPGFRPAYYVYQKIRNDPIQTHFDFG